MTDTPPKPGPSGEYEFSNDTLPSGNPSGKAILLTLLGLVVLAALIVGLVELLT